jgi:hypothetical protein
MNTYQANVLIHVDESVEPDQQAAFESMLGNVEGVTQVRSSARPHLTWVDYDPGVIGGKAILGRVQSQGLHAQLIGM